MKTKVLTTLFLLVNLTVFAQKSYLVGGSLTDRIAMIDCKTQSIVWEHLLDSEKQECNSVVYVKGGKIAYAYKQGAKLIDKRGEVIFDYNDLLKGEELHSISQIKGGYLVGLCGLPARIVELNQKGEVVKELTYDTGVSHPHSQFRQICKTSNDTYLIPLLSSNSIVEIDKNGDVLREIPLGHSPFSVTILRDGNLITACGHSGCVLKVDYESGAVTTLLDNDTIAESKVFIDFGAQICELRDGNYVLTNWLGHDGDMSQPTLIEFDPEGNVVWTLRNKLPTLPNISAICAIY